jgi:hypothetical protein
VSDVFETRFGYHIVKVGKRKPQTLVLSKKSGTRSGKRFWDMKKRGRKFFCKGPWKNIGFILSCLKEKIVI